MNPFPVLHLVEDLRLALEMLEHPQERAALLSQIPGPTAAYIKEWFQESLVSRPMACLGKIITEPMKCHHCLGLLLLLCAFQSFLASHPALVNTCRVVLPRRRVEPNETAYTTCALQWSPSLLRRVKSWARGEQT